MLLAVHVFLLNDNSSINQLSGIYVRDINCKDTLKLYPDGKMEQVIFNKDNKLVYSCISNWERTTMEISIDSIFIYDNINSLNYWREYPLEGTRYSGWYFEYIENKFVLSWRTYVDNPETCKHSIFRHDNFIGCFSADKIKMSVRKYFCFNIPIDKNMAEGLFCRSPYHEEYIQTSASGNPEDLCH